MKKILITGLPGSGKSTLSELLQQYLPADWHNADQVRAQAEDWDFSMAGRTRQRERMAQLATQSIEHGRYALADFVCPTNDLRRDFNADIVIFMNTIDSGRFADTNQIFETPQRADYIIDGWQHADELHKLARQIASDIRECEFNPELPTTQMLGRWQPWHAGHQALFERALEHNTQVVIQVRSTPRDQHNPFDFHQVKHRIQEALAEYAGKFIVQQVPNITHISYGRDVGYTIKQEVFDDQTHAVSATKIRNQLREQGKL